MAIGDTITNFLSARAEATQRVLTNTKRVASRFASGDKQASYYAAQAGIETLEAVASVTDTQIHFENGLSQQYSNDDLVAALNDIKADLTSDRNPNKLHTGAAILEFEGEHALETIFDLASQKTNSRVAQAAKQVIEQLANRTANNGVVSAALGYKHAYVSEIITGASAEEKLEAISKFLNHSSKGKKGSFNLADKFESVVDGIRGSFQYPAGEIFAQRAAAEITNFLNDPTQILDGYGITQFGVEAESFREDNPGLVKDIHESLANTFSNSVKSRANSEVVQLTAKIIGSLKDSDELKAAQERFGQITLEYSRDRAELATRKERLQELGTEVERIAKSGGSVLFKVSEFDILTRAEKTRIANNLGISTSGDLDTNIATHFMNNNLPGVHVDVTNEHITRINYKIHDLTDQLDKLLDGHTKDLEAIQEAFEDMRFQYGDGETLHAISGIEKLFFNRVAGKDDEGNMYLFKDYMSLNDDLKHVTDLFYDPAHVVTATDLNNLQGIEREIARNISEELNNLQARITHNEAFLLDLRQDEIDLRNNFTLPLRRVINHQIFTSDAKYNKLQAIYQRSESQGLGIATKALHDLETSKKIIQNLFHDLVDKGVSPFQANDLIQRIYQEDSYQNLTNDLATMVAAEDLSGLCEGIKKAQERAYIDTVNFASFVNSRIKFLDRANPVNGLDIVSRELVSAGLNDINAIDPQQIEANIKKSEFLIEEIASLEQTIADDKEIINPNGDLAKREKKIDQWLEKHSERLLEEYTGTVVSTFETLNPPAESAEMISNELTSYLEATESSANTDFEKLLVKMLNMLQSFFKEMFNTGANNNAQ